MKKYIPLVIASVTCFMYLGQKSFWLDEGISIFIASKNLKEMTSLFWHSESNMWFYYYLLHFWLYIAHNEFMIRSLSALLGICSIAVVYRLGRFLYNSSIGFTASLFISLNLFFIFYSQETRGYSLVFLLTNLSSLFFLQYISNKKTAFYPYLFVTILAIYTHIYALFVLFAQLIFLIVQKKLWNKIPFVCFLFLFITPIFIAPSIHSGQLNWVPRPSLSSIIGTFILFSGDMPPLLVIFGLLYLFNIRLKQNLKQKYLLYWLLVPILLSFSVSQFYPIYQSIYFIICLVPFMLTVSFALSQINNKRIYILLIGIISGLFLIRDYMWYTQNSGLEFVIKNHQEDWRDAAGDISKNQAPGDRVIIYGYYNKVVFQLYVKTNIIEVSSNTYNFNGGTRLPEPNMLLLKSLRNPHIWLVLNRADGTLFNRSIQRNEIQSAISENYYLSRDDEFYKVSVLHFTLKKNNPNN